MPLFGPPNVQKLKAKGNIKGLIKALGYKKDASVSQAAAEALGTLDWKPDRDEIGALYWIKKRRWDKCVEIGELAVTHLIVTLKDEESNEEVRRGAVEALEQIGDRRAVKPLITVLVDENKYVRIGAAKALGQIGDVQAVQPLIIQLKDEYSSDLPNAALEALVKIGTPAIEPLIVALEDESKSARKRAAEALGQIGDDRSAASLIVPLRDKSSYVHNAALEALLKIGAPAAVEPFCVALKDKDESVRKRAAEALGKIGDVRAVEPLIDVLETEKVSWVREAAAEALIQIGDHRALKPLIAVLLKEKPYLWEEWWIEVVGKLLDNIKQESNWDQVVGLYWISIKHWDRCVELGAAAIPLLETFVKANEVSMSVREGAAGALGQIGETCDIEILVALLRNRDWRVREAALYGLSIVKWRPIEDIERATYWIVNGDMNLLAGLDCQAIKQLLVESMEWEMGPDSWYVKGRIANILTRPEIVVNDSILQRTSDELEICAKKYTEILDRMVKQRAIGHGVIKHKQAIFEDYADLIVAATSYHVSEQGDGSGGGIYSYDTNSSLSAVKQLCKIMTPLSTNLLHHFSQLKDIVVTSRTFEVPYSSVSPSGMGSWDVTLSFENQRHVAKSELDRRGNPNYDLSAYKTEGCWCIPKK
ncbi:MAG: HEAT repeat domain-containing protein [Chloroflexi bacterium]|nr:HEAT repeat domain-containing protein [Chloroflexota bacterium]